MKKIYHFPEIEMVVFDDIDVLTASVLGDDIVVNADGIFGSKDQ